MQYKTIHEIENLKGKKVMLRLGLDVPIENGEIVDAFRIHEVIPTIHYLRDRGAKVIIISHIGDHRDETLLPVSNYLSSKGKCPNVFVQDIFSAEARHLIEDMGNGEVIFFENLRRWDGETKNDRKFAEILAGYADIYIDDAFSVMHRKHASIVGIPQFIPGFLGLQAMEEVKELGKSFVPEHPFIFIIGGAKVNTKLPLMKRFVGVADTIFVGGVLANDFFKAIGLNVGSSLTSDVEAPKDLVSTSGFMLPKDVVVARDDSGVTISPEDVLNEDKIFDVGPLSTKLLEEKIKDAKFVVWNGPLGWTEGGYEEATLAIAKAISESEAYSIIGGGDTLCAVPNEIEKEFDFVSTGGGAMLEFLANGTLPGLEALKRDFTEESAESLEN